MSVQMATLNTIMRLLKPVLSGQSDARVKKAVRPLPPAKLGGRAEDLAGVPCVWLNEADRDKGVVLYLHGGAYIGGPASFQWAWIDALARRAGLAALSVTYSLAPQHVHPTAIDEATRVTAELRARGVEHLVVAGDSAGGGLAAALMLRLRDEGSPLPRAALLLSPWVDITMSDPAGQALSRSDAMLSTEGLDKAAIAYAGTTDRRDPWLSPLFGDPTGLPPTWIHVGTREMFLPEDRAFAQLLAQHGVTVELVELKGGFHDSPVLLLLPEAKAALTQMVAFLAQHAAVGA